MDSANNKLTLECNKDGNQEVNKEMLKKVYSTYKQIDELEAQNKELRDTINRMEKEISMYKAMFKEANDTAMKTKEQMLIIIKTLTGKEIEFYVNPNDTVQQLKKEVEDKEGVPVGWQRLIFASKLLEDERILADYNIKDQSIIHLVMRPNPQ